MAVNNLSAVLDANGGAVKMLRNSQIGAYVYPVVPPRIHQLARRAARLARTAVLFDQTHHMAELIVEGPGRAQAVPRHSAINSFANFDLNRAKQIVPVHATDGYVIGDGILLPRAEDELVFVGRAPTVNWIQFHAETGGFKVRHHPRRPLALAAARQGRDAPPLPLPDPGPERQARSSTRSTAGRSPT